MRQRHARQALLVEVGEDGQRRVEAIAHVIAGDGLAARVEARYLAGAGVRRLEACAEAVVDEARAIDPSVECLAGEPADGRPAGEAPPWAGDLALPARDVAIGAYRALTVLRVAISPSVTKAVP
jgi:hypothetical protein